MLPLTSNITHLFFYMFILLCSSQTTPSPTTTTSTTTTTEAKDFLAITRIDIYALVAVLIGCPLFIAILCCWQKRKTKSTIQIRQKTVDKNLKRAVQSKQMLMHQQHMQLQQRQHAISVPAQPQAIQFTSQKPARPARKTQGALPQTATRKPASPKRGAQAFKSRKERPIAATVPVNNKALLNNQEDDIFGQFKPPPPAGPPPDDLLPPPPAGPPPKERAPAVKKSASVPKRDFMKVSHENQEKKELLSALELPVVEDDVTQSPPAQAPITQTFDRSTGAPQMPSVMVPLKSKESDSEEDNEATVPQISPIGANNASNNRMVAMDSDSSSGEAIGALAVAKDNNANPHEPKSSQPMPDLQTIFGRSVNKDDEDESDEDSLLQRQATFAANPAKMETPVNDDENVEIDIFTPDIGTAVVDNNDNHDEEEKASEFGDESESSGSSSEARARAGTEIIHDV